MRIRFIEQSGYEVEKLPYNIFDCLKKGELMMNNNVFRCINVLFLAVLVLTGYGTLEAVSASESTVEVTGITIVTVTNPELSLGSATAKDGKSLTFTSSIGSGAFHVPADPSNIIYSVTDRGPTFGCDEAEDIVGVGADVLCQGDEGGEIFMLPAFSPTIYKIELGSDGTVDILEIIPLKDSSGTPITALINPFSAAVKETSYGPDGEPLKMDPNALDPEAIVKLSDGSFWLGEEYGPSVVHVAGDGRIIKRFIPQGEENNLADAGYEVSGALPAVLMKRKANRGIESLAVSPDEHFLYFSMQSPLANPDAAAYKKSRHVRLMKFDIASEKIVGEYLYELSTPETFAADNAKKARKQKDVKVNSVLVAGPDRLLILERISKTHKLFEVNLANATDISAVYDDPALSPTLEESSAAEVAAKGVKPVSKRFILDTDDYEGLPSKIEGVALADNKTLIMLNDSDFGLDGAANVIVRIEFAKPLVSE
ncbi:MAG: esterase-like activity of phytase family protein [bacterium]|nr:esterase-like activity of phytase family protein [bacterium]